MRVNDGLNTEQDIETAKKHVKSYDPASELQVTGKYKSTIIRKSGTKILLEVTIKTAFDKVLDVSSYYVHIDIKKNDYNTYAFTKYAQTLEEIEDYIARVKNDMRMGID